MSGSNASPGSDPFAPDFEAWQRRCFEYKLTGKNKPPHPSIEMIWDSFAKSLGTELPPTIVGLVKQAFFGGALGFFFVVTKIGEVWNEDEGSAIVNKLEAELQSFMVQQAEAHGVTMTNTSSIVQ